ncbi:MAG: GWxTD domain-containing protein [Bacteroidota bacterium]|nr:GWxTD domain-containing protein [Bacteroidota bacterium]
MRLSKIIIGFIIPVVFWASCVSIQPTGILPNYSSHYNPANSVLNPEYQLYRYSSNLARLYLKLNTNELKFSSANTDAQYRAEIKISYLVTPSFTDKTIIDSSSQIIKLKYNKRQNQLVTSIDLSTGHLKDYVVYVKLTDKNSFKESRNFCLGSNMIKDNHQQYLIKRMNQKPVFTSYLNTHDTFYVKNNTPGLEQIFISKYSQSFGIASPPFNTTNTPESVETYDLTYSLPYKNGNSIFLIREPGLYKLQTDTTVEGGKIIYVGDPDFPNITSVQKLMEPLQYLLNTSEYDSIRTKDNRKLEIDKFWLRAAGNKDKAGQLIQVWYTRVKYANYYFSSFKPGWKTDRGMIFIMFGPPDILNYSDEGEHWVYRSKSKAKTEMTFIKQQHKISENDYVLKRKSYYTTWWYKAVRSWRSGVIY